MRRKFNTTKRLCHGRKAVSSQLYMIYVSFAATLSNAMQSRRRDY